MNLVVCVKRVPDTATQVRVGADGKSLETGGVSYVINPYDEFAVEECVKIKEAKGGDVTVVSVGPAASTKELRSCLAMGADKAILLKDETANRDPYSTARALADTIKELPHDIVFFGKQAVDHDNAQVGVIVATLLGLPVVAEVVKVEVGEGSVTVHRESEGQTEVYEVPTPCVLTAQKGLNEPRFTSLKAIMAAKKKPLEERDAQLPDNQIEVLGMELPPPRPEGRILGEGVDAVPELVRVLREEAKAI